MRGSKCRELLGGGCKHSPCLSLSDRESEGGASVRLRTVTRGGGCAWGPFPVYRTWSAPLGFPVSCDVSCWPGDCLLRAVIRCSVTGKLFANGVSAFSDSHSMHLWCALKNLKPNICNYWEIKTGGVQQDWFHLCMAST